MVGCCYTNQVRWVVGLKGTILIRDFPRIDASLITFHQIQLLTTSSLIHSFHHILDFTSPGFLNPISFSWFGGQIFYTELYHTVFVIQNFLYRILWTKIYDPHNFHSNFFLSILNSLWIGIGVLVFISFQTKVYALSEWVTPIFITN